MKERGILRVRTCLYALIMVATCRGCAVMLCLRSPVGKQNGLASWTEEALFGDIGRCQMYVCMCNHDG